MLASRNLKNRYICKSVKPNFQTNNNAIINAMQDGVEEGKKLVFVFNHQVNKICPLIS